MISRVFRLLYICLGPCSPGPLTPPSFGGSLHHNSPPLYTNLVHHGSNFLIARAKMFHCVVGWAGGPAAWRGADQCACQHGSPSDKSQGASFLGDHKSCTALMAV